MAQQQYAPVAMFVYNRADNTQRTLEALVKNTLAASTDVYVFSDGGRDARSWAQVAQVRQTVKTMARQIREQGLLRSITLVERPENYYLERNITEGIAQVLAQHDSIIVLEDDIVTSPYFLQYMNDGLTLYRNSSRMMHVSGFTHLCLQQGVEGNDFYFTPHMAGWGWGTWRDRWQQHFRHYASREEALQGMTEKQIREMEYDGRFPCLHSLDRSPIPWDICWEIAIKRADGLCLTPARTMVRNIGLYSGTHFRSSTLLQHFSYDREPLQRPLTLHHVVNPHSVGWVEETFGQTLRDWGVVYTPLGRVVRWVYRKIKGKDKG